MKTSWCMTRKPPRACWIPALLAGALAASCANRAGDDVECPTCDGTSEARVGTRCVPLAEIEACGPAGHAHGTECHCDSGQPPTAIGGIEYCLQLACGEEQTDPAALACDQVGHATESVAAVASLAEIERAHLDLGQVVEVVLPAGVESFVHFGAAAPGEAHVFASLPGVVQAALTPDGTPLAATLEGANEACPAALPETWGVQVAAAGPVVLRLAAGAVPSLALLVVEGGHDH